VEVGSLSTRGATSGARTIVAALGDRLDRGAMDAEAAELARELSVAHGVSARVIAADLADPASPERIVEELEAERTVHGQNVNY
jgi:NAD(P)-dependent dehydrogenase (short-subunit alcohol dehydrogenase family)